MPVRPADSGPGHTGRSDPRVRPVRPAVPRANRRPAQGLRDMIGGFADYGRALVNIFR